MVRLDNMQLAACSTLVEGEAKILEVYSYTPILAGSKVDYGLYGVFDGHGGKQAATFASKHILPVLQQQLASVQASSGVKLAEELEDYREQLPAEDTAAWQAQGAFAEALPRALVETFRQVQEQFHAHTKVRRITALCTYTALHAFAVRSD